ncbi:MAG: hypothetical protein QN120_02300, partial [Armatimonadota bacterium]|nr:hypothetical protein [Armatimonadota bacterium]
RRAAETVLPIAGGSPTELPAPTLPPFPPVVVEVLAPVLLASGLALLREGSPLDLLEIGRAVHREEVLGYPPHMREEYRRLWRLLHDVHARYGDAVLIRIIAPASLRWFAASLRHRVRHYPTFIVDGQDRVTGWDPHALVGRIERHLAARRGPESG